MRRGTPLGALPYPAFAYPADSIPLVYTIRGAFYPSCQMAEGPAAADVETWVRFHSTIDRLGRIGRRHGMDPADVRIGRQN